MRTVQPVCWMDPEKLQANLRMWISKRQPDTLGRRLNEVGVTREGFHQLINHPVEVARLVRLLAANPAGIGEVLAQQERALSGLRPPLPMFQEILGPGWLVLEDRGQALPADWDPHEFLAGRAARCVDSDGGHNTTGLILIETARRRLHGRPGLSQHELARLIELQDKWGTLPHWFQEAMQGGQPELVATETLLLHEEGSRCVLSAVMFDGELRVCAPIIDSPWWYRGQFQFMVAAETPDLLSGLELPEGGLDFDLGDNPGGG